MMTCATCLSILFYEKQDVILHSKTQPSWPHVLSGFIFTAHVDQGLLLLNILGFSKSTYNSDFMLQLISPKQV